jgi:hypothetical protein
MSKWVQHISGQGQKFELAAVEQHHHDFWQCIRKCPGSHYLRLPVSEYIECEGPEEWEDVTEVYRDCQTPIRLRDDERIKFIDGLHNGPAFIVERKKS